MFVLVLILGALVLNSACMSLDSVNQFEKKHKTTALQHYMCDHYFVLVLISLVGIDMRLFSRLSIHVRTKNQKHCTLHARLHSLFVSHKCKPCLTQHSIFSCVQIPTKISINMKCTALSQRERNNNPV